MDTVLAVSLVLVQNSPTVFTSFEDLHSFFNVWVRVINTRTGTEKKVLHLAHVMYDCGNLLRNY